MPTRVRSRTLTHLESLLALSAIAAGCHNTGTGYGVVDPMPAPPPSGDPGPTSTIPEAAGTTPPPTVATPPTPPDLGYGVVDPMPPPADCTTFSESLYAYASVVDGMISVSVAAQQRFRGSTVLTTTAPAIAHAKVDTAEVTPNVWTLKLVPDGTVHTLTIPVDGTCASASARASVRLNWDGALTGETRVDAVVVEGTK